MYRILQYLNAIILIGDTLRLLILLATLMPCLFEKSKITRNQLSSTDTIKQWEV